MCVLIPQHLLIVSKKTNHLLTVPCSLLQTGSGSLHYVRFTHPQEVRFLSIDEQPAVGQLKQFENLTILECNEIESFVLSSIASVISGAEGQLTELHCNLTKFETTDYVPEEDLVEFLEDFYNSLRSTIGLNVESAVFEFTEIREGLSIFFNGVELDLQRLRFNDYHFHEVLISMQLHNRQTNRLTVRPSKTVFQTDYIDVCTFLAIQLQPNQWAVNFPAFVGLYPNVREINIHKDEQGQKEIRSAELLPFFLNCRGLQKLHFYRAGLESDFYSALARMTCCSRLTSLAIHETSEFTHHIDFTFLAQLPSLVLFETNAAPRERLLNGLAAMRSATAEFPEQRLDFHFRSPADLMVVTFVRLNQDPWTMTIYPRGRTSDAIVQQMQVNSDALPAFFRNPMISDLTPHWIDPDIQMAA